MNFESQWISMGNSDKVHLSIIKENAINRLIIREIHSSDSLVFFFLMAMSYTLKEPSFQILW